VKGSLEEQRGRQVRLMVRSLARSAQSSQLFAAIETELMRTIIHGFR
jgi:hypothetical protein